jgi:hypothetical protein
MTFDQFENRVATALKGIFLRRFLRLVCSLDYDLQKPSDLRSWKEAQIPTDKLLAVLIGDWLQCNTKFTEGQVYEIVHKAPLSAWAQGFRGKDVDKLPVFAVDICDYLWIAYTKLDGFLHVQDLRWVEKLPRPAVTHLFMDVTACYLRARRKIAINEPHDDELSDDELYGVAKDGVGAAAAGG